MNVDKLNGVGVLFRFITPVLITIVGMLILFSLGNIQESVVALDGHFTNHLSHHTLIEKEYEHRITKLEREDL